MQEIRSLIASATSADIPIERHIAFGEIVVRFQDMAYGCAYAILRDHDLAEDAAQEAFITAWQHLYHLHHPEAFPGWFRQIVLTQCFRLIRGNREERVSLEAIADVPSTDLDPQTAVEKQELKDRVLEAIRALLEPERMVTTLFYINGYSQREIADFLEVSVQTVKNRLHAARKRLKGGILAMVQEDLYDQRPSQDETFVTRVLEMVHALMNGDHASVRVMLTSEPSLAEGLDLSSPFFEPSVVIVAAAKKDTEQIDKVFEHFMRNFPDSPIQHDVICYFFEAYAQVPGTEDRLLTLGDRLIRSLEAGEGVRSTIPSSVYIQMLTYFWVERVFVEKRLALKKAVDYAERHLALLETSGKEGGHCHATKVRRQVPSILMRGNGVSGLSIS